MNELARLRGRERYGACDDEGKEPHRAHPPGTGIGRTARNLNKPKRGGVQMSNTVPIGLVSLVLDVFTLMNPGCDCIKVTVQRHNQQRGTLPGRSV